MNKILDRIYLHYEDMPIDENSLETPEISKALDSFFTTYFGYMSKCHDEYELAWHKLLDLILVYQERAFETGFYAGIELMNGNILILTCSGGDFLL